MLLRESSALSLLCDVTGEALLRLAALFSLLERRRRRWSAGLKVLQLLRSLEFS